MHIDDDIHPKWLAAGVFKWISEIIKNTYFNYIISTFHYSETKNICNHWEPRKKFVGEYIFLSCKLALAEEDVFFTYPLFALKWWDYSFYMFWRGLQKLQKAGVWIPARCGICRLYWSNLTSILVQLTLSPDNL